jgi:LytS/YehU family sensor histidine kinase
MESQDLALVHHWLEFSAQLVPRICVVVVGAFACIRLQWVRRALRGLATSWRHRLTMILAFGGLGVLATHSGILVEVGPVVKIMPWPPGLALDERQAVVGFRDTMVLAGGLIGGPWVGMGAGLLAGAERYWLGGFAAVASGLATLCLGACAGWARHFGPRRAATLAGAFTVAMVGTVLHRVFLLWFAQPYDWIVLLIWEIAIPVAVVNCLGCVLFLWVARDLDRDRLESELREARWLRQEAELRALRAQVEPHFLNNTLAAIGGMFRLDPERAREYLAELAAFFRDTQRSARANSIALREEVAQLNRYLDLQQLRFGKKIDCRIDVPAGLLDCHLPPHSLLALAENALTHGRQGRAAGFWLRVEAEDLGASWTARVADNGCGIPPERLAKLGKEPVDSPRSNGTALHQLAGSLRLVFDGQASLAIDSTPGQGTRVALILPKQEGEGR